MYWITLLLIEPVFVIKSARTASKTREHHGLRIVDVDSAMIDRVANVVQAVFRRCVGKSFGDELVRGGIGDTEANCVGCFFTQTAINDVAVQRSDSRHVENAAARRDPG